MFVASQLLSAITQPLFWLALWWALALLILLRWRKTAIGMLWGGLVVLGLLGFQALPDALLRPLENRYTAPDAATLDGYAGVIVLGGALGHPALFSTRQQVPLGAAAERMTEPLTLLRQHPQLRLIFSSGEGRLLTTGVTESVLAQAFYQAQGMDMRRVTFEHRSRNTRENAQQVAQLLGPQCRTDKPAWLLVTSAWHMPRAKAEFDAVGCAVTPYPVDYKTGSTTPWYAYAIANSLLTWQIALHEWLGLLVYGLTR